MRKNLRELASLPSERKIWVLRRFYAGNGGCLPPTDPRILSMTPEQIDLEFEHIALDKKMKDKANGSQVYEDDEFDAYDEETSKVDSKLSDMDSGFGSEVDPHGYAPVGGMKDPNEEEGDWVDVETDDY